jgi:hypothetical protein
MPEFSVAQFVSDYEVELLALQLFDCAARKQDELTILTLNHRCTDVRRSVNIGFKGLAYPCPGRDIFKDSRQLGQHTWIDSDRIREQALANRMGTPCLLSPSDMLHEFGVARNALTGCPLTCKPHLV